MFNPETEELLVDFTEAGQRFLIAKGGKGGWGNAHFATPTRRAPKFHYTGRPGEEKELQLELKLIADVGLVGFPNAGKSTLISVISAAKPKIADYPFTTLVPQLGVVADGPQDEPFVIADLPGLIAGASQGSGLGIQFLRHVERCRVLVHLVDLSAEGSALTDLETVERELEAFNPDLLLRPRLLVGSKLDAAQEEQSERRIELAAAARSREIPYFEISSATSSGIRELVRALRLRLTTPRSEFRAEAEQPKAADPVEES